MNIALTGFMATGKTRISKELSKLLNFDRIDTDGEIVKIANMSINDIFAVYGEEHFRCLEKEVCKKVSMLDNTVISTGGGVVLDKENLTSLRQNGIIVNLDADFSVIEARVQKASKTRPLMKNSSIEEIKARFESRKPFYADCDLSIKISDKKTPKEHAQIIINELKSAKLI